VVRFFDIVLSFLGLVMCSPIFITIFFIILLSNGAPLFVQQRSGRFEKPFALIKFRTMHQETLSLPTHLVEPEMITSIGSFLRKTKLDEIPQLWNVLKGDMSLVGPRPGLVEHEELSQVRREKGVFCVRPGITGLAQINKVDMSNPVLLAEVDAEMISKLNLGTYFQLIFLTLLGKGLGDRVRG
jgi:O-antigen biosynthesis protein WbqP